MPSAFLRTVSLSAALAVTPAVAEEPAARNEKSCYEF